MIETILFFSLLLVIIGLLLSFVYIELNKKNIDPKLIQIANKKIQETQVLDPNLSLIESHKIMVNTLKTVFKNQKLSSAKMLNKVSKNFKDEKEFWFYHRMRNKVAHETDYKITIQDANKARKVFQSALSSCK
jgi:predicted phage tail protein